MVGPRATPWQDPPVRCEIESRRIPSARKRAVSPSLRECPPSSWRWSSIELAVLEPILLGAEPADLERLVVVTGERELALQTSHGWRVSSPRRATRSTRCLARILVGLRFGNIVKLSIMYSSILSVCD